MHSFEEIQTYIFHKIQAPTIFRHTSKPILVFLKDIPYRLVPLVFLSQGIVMTVIYFCFCIVTDAMPRIEKLLRHEHVLIGKQWVIKASHRYKSISSICREYIRNHECPDSQSWNISHVPLHGHFWIVELSYQLFLPLRIRIGNLTSIDCGNARIVFQRLDQTLYGCTIIRNGILCHENHIITTCLSESPVSGPAMVEILSLDFDYLDAFMTVEKIKRTIIRRGIHYQYFIRGSGLFKNRADHLFESGSRIQCRDDQRYAFLMGITHGIQVPYLPAPAPPLWSCPCRSMHTGQAFRQGQAYHQIPPYCDTLHTAPCSSCR